jgi:TPR repeat protein
MGEQWGQGAHTITNSIAAAMRGDVNAYYELGVAYSAGTSGVGLDLVEAHKWFNLAALGHHARAQQCRADIATEMSLREIAEAQRQARSWLQHTAPRCAA